MTTNIYGFEKQDADKLLRISRQQRDAVAPGVIAVPKIQSSTWLMKATTAITAREGVIAGSGTAKLTRRDLDTDEIIDHLAEDGSTIEITVYNDTDTQVASGDYVKCVSDRRNTIWVIPTARVSGFEVGQDCGFFVSGTTPKRILLDMVGWANGSCSDCVSVFDKQVELEQDDNYRCTWVNSTDVNGSCASHGEISCRITQQVWDATQFSADIQILNQSGGIDHYLGFGWTEESGKIDGLTFDRLSPVGGTIDNSSECDSSGIARRIRSKVAA